MPMTACQLPPEAFGGTTGFGDHLPPELLGGMVGFGDQGIG